jgi:protein-L-isoaspartate(D-aspartate) O-methyltransferase
VSWITPVIVWLVALSCVASGPLEEKEDNEQKARDSMVANQLASRDIDDKRVLEVMGQVPRHLFVPAGMRAYAYQDNPLPIGLNQTISQPYIVALMTQLADPSEDNKALEVGTGSGYQAAVLSRLVNEVYTIEIIPGLAERARTILKELGYENVFVRQGDGYQGWPENAPFDIVLVTAAATVIPEPLIEQLAEGGRLIMPVGEVGGVQVLTRLTKKDGKIEKERVLGVRFVPMTGEVQKQ